MPSITPAEYAAYQAKRSRPAKDDCASGSDGAEQELQRAIIQCCRSNGWKIYGGSMAHRTFRTVGEHDFWILLPRSKFLLVECKSRKGKLSLAQLGNRMDCANLGHTVHVVRSLSGFLQLVNHTLTT